MKFINLIGKRFYYLVVVAKLPNDKFNKIVWKCRCDCGNITKAITQHLNNGNIKSCGCLAKNNGFKHGMSNSRTYNAWAGIISRCTNSNDTAYKYYGGNNPPINVCNRWNSKKSGSFKNFLEDMGKCPSKAYSIDRIDNNLGYYKENCRWATSKQQHRNMNSNRFYSFNGKTQILNDWAKEYSIRRQTLSYRLNKGVSIEEALTTPVKNYRRKK